MSPKPFARPANGPTCDLDSRRYQAPIDPDSEASAAKVIRLVGNGKYVLELGAATGSTSRVLTERGCRVVGVELDPYGAALASAFCEDVLVTDLDRTDLVEMLAGEQFDVVVAADVLEHLRDPGSVLTAVRSLLAPDGCVVASIPNIAHGDVRLALLGGSFDYRESGLLDRTHLRFFTDETMRQLFRSCGYAIESVDRVIVEVGRSEVGFNRKTVPRRYLKRLARDEDARTYQFIVRARPLPAASEVMAPPGVLRRSTPTGTQSAPPAENELIAAQRQAIRDQAEVIGWLERRVHAYEIYLRWCDPIRAFRRGKAVARQVTSKMRRGYRPAP